MEKYISNILFFKSDLCKAKINVINMRKSARFIARRETKAKYSEN